MIDGDEVKLFVYDGDVNFSTANVQLLNLIFNMCKAFGHFSS